MKNIDPELLSLIREYVNVVKNDNDSFNNTITLLAIIVPAVISLLVIFSQNKLNLKLKKIDVLSRSKDELRYVRSQIINYIIPTNPNQTITPDQYNSMLLDSAIIRMINVMSVSEHFPKELSSELDANYKSVQDLIGLAKQGKNIDEKQAMNAIKKVQDFEPKMINALNNSIFEIQNQIDKLVKNN
jgi:hypothetical protein